MNTLDTSYVSPCIHSQDYSARYLNAIDKKLGLEENDGITMSRGNRYEVNIK